MANISLQGSIRTCKVDPGYSPRIASDRFLNPELALCPVWTGVDNLGRPVNPFSFYTKNAGCNSSSDLVTIENDQRPRYVEYVTLDARGYLNEQSSFLPDKEAVRNAAISDLRKVTGNPGFGFGASVYPGCAYGDGVGMNNYVNRVNNMAAAGMQTQRNKNAAGLTPQQQVRMQQARMQQAKMQQPMQQQARMQQAKMQQAKMQQQPRMQQARMQVRSPSNGCMA
jgi:hypothetical protein